MSSLGQLLEENRAVQAAEIVFVFIVAFVVIAIGWQLVGTDVLARQAVVWVANVLMLATIWAGSRLRGQDWSHFGLSFQWPQWRSVLFTFLQSIVIFILALAAFVLGSMVMNATTPEQTTDVSSYAYLQGNLPMLLLALAAVYIVSSFGEEMLYRGFLINRLAEMGRSSRWAWGIAAAISAIIFGLIHFDWGIVGIVQTTFMGVAFAVAYLVTKRNLWALILAHVYLDTLLLVQIYLS